MTPSTPAENWDRLDDLGRDSRIPKGRGQLLGTLAILEGWIDAAQLDAALRQQAEGAAQGRSERIGQVFIRQGLLTQDHVDLLLRRQLAEAVEPDAPKLPRYRISKLIGEGGMGRVFRAQDIELDRPVAVKVLKEPAASSPLVQKRFLREARVAAGLSHPNIITLHDFGDHEGRMYLVFELVEGVALHRYLEENDLALPERLLLLEKIARAISVAHAKGIVHRDLKPGNIIVTAEGEPKVGDFGLAFIAESNSSLTRADAIVGTPQYMAPEQVDPKLGEVTPETDVYALGVILYETIAGQLPYLPFRTLHELYSRITTGTIQSLRQAFPDLPRGVEFICVKALEKRPADRYRTAHELAEDLARFREGRDVLARPSSAVRTKVHRAVLAVAAAAVIAILAWAATRPGPAAPGPSPAASDSDPRLNVLWSAVMDAKRELRQLRTPPAEARQRLEKSISAVERFVQVHPGEPRGWLVLARGKMYLGLMADAERLLVDRLRRAPDFRPGWNLLGMVWMERFQDTFFYFAGTHEECIRRQDAILAEADGALGRGLTPGKEREETEAAGLTWSREDEIQLNLVEALRLFQKNKTTAAARLLKDQFAAYQAEEYAFCLATFEEGEDNLLKWTTKALELAPGYDRALMGRGIHSVNAHRHAEAKADFDRALLIRPDFTLVLYARAGCREHLGDLPGADQDLTDVIRLNPDLPEGFHRRGQVRRARGMSREAIEDFTTAIRLRENSPDSYDARGEAHISRGGFEEATADFDQAILLKPDHAMALLHRGALRRILGDIPAALADYRKALESGGNVADIRAKMGEALRSQGDFEGAMREYGEAIRARPDWSGGWSGRGSVRLMLMELDEADRDFRKALDLNSKDAEAHMGMGLVFIQRADNEAGLVSLGRAIELRPEYYEARFARAIALGNLKRFDAAILDWDRAVDLQPSNPEARYRRALVRIAQGDRARARGDLGEALRLGSEAWSSRGDAEAQLERLGSE